MNLGDRYDMQDTPESADERECAKSAAYEREIDRADYLRDEAKDRRMEEAMERDEVARRANPIQSELSRLRAENAELLAALRDVMTPYSIYDAAVAKAVGVAIIEQFVATGDRCRAAITKAESVRAADNARMADILRNSLPKAVEPASPVPQRLQDEISAAHLRATPAARPPRFFCETSTGMTWEFRNGKMTTDNGEDSMFKSPAEILECLDVIEVDENGNPLA